MVSCGKLFRHSLQKLKKEKAQAREVFVILDKRQPPGGFHSFPSETAEEETTLIYMAALQTSEETRGLL